ncbi:DUF1415 domain-containing protein [Marinobacteraceae bacterium S3BR75-40.1]
MQTQQPDAVIEATRQWLERAVIGLNLCPFARVPYRREQIRYHVSAAQSLDDLLDELVSELLHLARTEADSLETTLLIHPQVLTDFEDFVAFLERADEVIDALELRGVLQVASFHPQYQFADSDAEAIENYTNRAPFPLLHLLREASIERAVATHPDPDSIYQRNIETLRQLGRAGWDRLWE